MSADAMNLVLYTHPAFLGSHSQAHFARLLAQAFRERGHSVDLRQPAAWLQPRLAGRLAKWGGYVDQYLVFPPRMRAAMQRDPDDTLYVFCDQALGPWVPNAAHRPHVVHCHDLLALRSALGDVAENPTSATGRIYQRYIRSGFRHARHFISISHKSRDDLHRFGGVHPLTSEVVYNGLNHPYRPRPVGDAEAVLAAAGLKVKEHGFLLHVGGGQWYKNSRGVVRLYGAYADDLLRAGRAVPPLWMVSPAPDDSLRAVIATLAPQAEVRFINGLGTEVLEALYSRAHALLFPSLAEGFGWPIAEALACGCPVVTTGDAPMTEVGGEACTYLRRLAQGDDLAVWAHEGALALGHLLGRDAAERARQAAIGCAHAARFAAEDAIDHYLDIYRRVLAQEIAKRIPTKRASHGQPSTSS